MRYFKLKSYGNPPFVAHAGFSYCKVLNDKQRMSYNFEKKYFQVQTSNFTITDNKMSYDFIGHTLTNEIVEELSRSQFKRIIKTLTYMEELAG